MIIKFNTGKEIRDAIYRWHELSNMYEKTNQQYEEMENLIASLLAMAIEFEQMKLRLS